MNPKVNKNMKMLSKGLTMVNSVYLTNDGNKEQRQKKPAQWANHVQAIIAPGKNEE